MIKNKNKPQKPSPDHPIGVLWYNDRVSKSRQGAYRPIMEALVAAPTYIIDEYYIHIEVGLYEERRSLGISTHLSIILFHPFSRPA
ncbi:hypothetical protein ACJIZ3_009336 [Penstemon smallii]|uniref:Uncharacterized protein n=1 Tax=Penstemon smallii TaxID=265156 RepID=A0ABD3TD12_9LAMI